MQILKIVFDNNKIKDDNNYSYQKVFSSNYLLSWFYSFYMKYFQCLQSVKRV